jgi:small subunit ribosomal protein S1
MQEEHRGYSPRGRSGAPAERCAGTPLDWSRARELYEQDGIAQVSAVGCNRGGLLVEAEGLRGFVPASHVMGLPALSSEEERHDLMLRRVGSIMCVKIIEFDPERGRIVFSERAAQAGPGCRASLLASLRPGDRRTGEVTNITNFGVFVDLGGMEGLVHVSEISWGRVRHPCDHVSCGQRVEVEVLSIDRDQGRVALSLKRMHPDPWAGIDERYVSGQQVPCCITRVTTFGAFAALEEGIEGLIHISELCADPLADPRSAAQEGDHVVARILSVDGSARRIALSLRPVAESVGTAER